MDVFNNHEGTMKAKIENNSEITFNYADVLNLIIGILEGRSQLYAESNILHLKWEDCTLEEKKMNPMILRFLRCLEWDLDKFMYV